MKQSKILSARKVPHAASRHSKPVSWFARLAFVSWLLGVSSDCPAQPSFGRVKNFAVPEYFAPPNQNQMKSLLKGEEAVPIEQGRVLIKNARLETFRASGEREMLINAPECIYDPAKKTASSPGALQVQTADARFFIEGEGFLWKQSPAGLIISNRVHTVIREMPEDIRKP